MPLYEYDCSTCGDFTASRKIADPDAPCACPECGAQALRVILTAPGLATLPGNTRRAMDLNEQSRHAPKTVDQYCESRRNPSGGRWAISH